MGEAHDRARGIIRTYRAKLDELSRYLIEHETIEANDFQAMFAGVGAAA